MHKQVGNGKMLKMKRKKKEKQGGKQKCLTINFEKPACIISMSQLFIAFYNK